MKIRTLVGLSILLTSQFVFAETCKEELTRICSTCKYEDICDAIEEAKLPWESGSELAQCVQKTINSMSADYFKIQYNIEGRGYSSNNNSYNYNNNNNNYGGSGSSSNSNYDSRSDGSWKFYDNNKNNDLPDFKYQADDKKSDKRKGVIIINGTNYSDGTGRNDSKGSQGKGSQSGSQGGGVYQTGSGSNSGSNSGGSNNNDYQAPQTYRIQGFADKIVRDCEKDFRLKDRPRTKVKVVGESNFHSSTLYTDTKTLFGGLSGMTRLKGKDGKESKELIVVSDDKTLPTMVQVNWYEDPVMDPAKPFKFKFIKRTGLDRLYQEYTRQERVWDPKEDKDAKPKYRTVKEKWAIDTDREDVVLLPNGNLLVSSETGDLKSYDGSPAKATLFQEFDLEGKLVGGLPSPTDFVSEFKSYQRPYDCTPYTPPPPPKDSGSGKGSGSGSGSGFGPSTPAPSAPGSTNPPPPPKSSTTYSASASASVPFSPLLDNREPCGEKKKGDKTEKKTCYTTETKRIGGLDFNKGIEAMTIVPTTDEILFTNESPLVQDKPENGWFSAKEDEYVRMYTVRYGSWADRPPVKYYRYPMKLTHDNGVPAILALDSSRVLVLERGYDPVDREAVVRLYKVELADADRNGNLHKELIVDFNDLKPQFAAGFKKIDNFEGMALGPVRDGKQIVFLVSDNNFSASQRTTFLAIAIPQEALK